MDKKGFLKPSNNRLDSFLVVKTPLLNKRGIFKLISNRLDCFLVYQNISLNGQDKRAIFKLISNRLDCFLVYQNISLNGHKWTWIEWKGLLWTWMDTRGAFQLQTCQCHEWHSFWKNKPIQLDIIQNTFHPVTGETCHQIILHVGRLHFNMKFLTEGVHFWSLPPPLLSLQLCHHAPPLHFCLFSSPPHPSRSLLPLPAATSQSSPVA